MSLSPNAGILPILQKKIAQSDHARLPFNIFMDVLLYHPQWGYYCQPHKQPFGTDGDFVTAPLISPVFGQCIATQCAEILTHIMSRPYPHCGVLEIGAGTGALAEQVLIRLSEQHALPQSYFILEISPTLRKQQQQYLKTALPDSLFSRLNWLENVYQCPTFSGVVLANEVADALPTHRIRKTKQGWETAHIIHGKQGLGYEWLPVSHPDICTKIQAYQTLLSALPLPYVTEMRTNYSNWLHDLSHVLTSGTLLLIDYGYTAQEYYHPERSNGTLRCYYQHRAHDDPFLHLGQQDISAHVDFTDLAHAGMTQGLEITGWVTQADFLINCGLENEMQRTLSHLSQHIHCPDQRARAQYAFSQSIQTLMLPGQMGEAVKVLGLTKRDTAYPALRGFLRNDRAHLLFPH